MAIDESDAHFVLCNGIGLVLLLSLPENMSTHFLSKNLLLLAAL
jgi:hypothetical protein